MAKKQTSSGEPAAETAAQATQGDSGEPAIETGAQAAPASALQFARDPDHETPEVQPPLVDQEAPTYTLRADDQRQRSMFFGLLRLVRGGGPADRLPELERTAREFELYEAAHRG